GRTDWCISLDLHAAHRERTQDVFAVAVLPRRAPQCPLFPYTTLFRSRAGEATGGGSRQTAPPGNTTSTFLRLFSRAPRTRSCLSGSTSRRLSGTAIDRRPAR